MGRGVHLSSRLRSSGESRKFPQAGVTLNSASDYSAIELTN